MIRFPAHNTFVVKRRARSGAKTANYWMKSIPMEAAAVPRPVSLEEQSVRSPVVVVDLDGTLVKTDLLLESLLALLKQTPYFVFCLPFWLLKGKAYLKQQIASRVSLDVSVLPYRDDVLDYLK